LHHHRRRRVEIWLRKKGAAKLLAKVESVLGTLPILPMDSSTDIEYGGIRAELEAAGQINVSIAGAMIGLCRCRSHSKARKIE